jgi:hypothetical protein
VGNKGIEGGGQAGSGNRDTGRHGGGGIGKETPLVMAVTNAQHIGTSKSARHDSLVDDEYYKGMLVCCAWCGCGCVVGEGGGESHVCGCVINANAQHRQRMYENNYICAER